MTGNIQPPHVTEVLHLRSRSGLTLIGIIAAIAVMGLLGAGVLMLVSIRSMESILTLQWSQSFFAAESGVSAAKTYMATNATWYTNSSAITGTVGQASFSAILDAYGAITSVGSKDEAQWTSRWQPTWHAMLVYGTRTNAGTPQYRIWGGTNWSNPSNCLSVGTTSINWVVTRACPIRDEYVAVTLATNRTVTAQIWRDGSWGNLQAITNVSVSANRGVDVAYESLSGDAVVVSADGDADPTYYVWDGDTWTGPGTVNLSRTGIARWVKLASDPVSDELIVMVMDSNRFYTAQVWNGGAWGNELLCTGQTVVVNYEAMDVEYETSGNQGIIVNNSGVLNAGKFNWSSWDGTNWSAQSTNNTLGDYLCFGRLENDPNSDELLLTYVDYDADIGKVYWSGSAWGAYSELDTAANAALDRCVYGQFETIGTNAGHGLATYSDTTASRSRHAIDPSVAAASWAAEVSVDVIQDSATVQTRRTGDGKILAVFFDDVNSQYDFSWHNGTNWSTMQTLEANPSVIVTPFKEPFMMAPQRWVLP